MLKQCDETRKELLGEMNKERSKKMEWNGMCINVCMDGGCTCLSQRLLSGRSKRNGE